MRETTRIVNYLYDSNLNICDVSNLGDYETITVTTPEGKEIKTKLYGR